MRVPGAARSGGTGPTPDPSNQEETMRLATSLPPRTLALATPLTLLLALGPDAAAQTVSVDVRAVVTNVTDDQGVLGGAVSVGQELTGTYLYDLQPPLVETSPFTSQYTSAGAPSGFTVRAGCGGPVFQSDPAGPELVITIIDLPFPPLDQYLAASSANAPLPDGTAVEGILLALSDSSGAALSGTDLAAQPPAPEDFELAELLIEGDTPPGLFSVPAFRIEADVTSLELTPPALAAGVESLSIAAGGAQALALTADPCAFGGSLYLVLGSLSGTDPGLPLESVVLPLNPDDYTTFTLTNASDGVILVDTLGLLDAQGTAAAAIQVPPWLSPSLAGTVLNHAFLALDGFGSVGFASNAVELTLLP